MNRYRHEVDDQLPERPESRGYQVLGLHYIGTSLVEVEVLKAENEDPRRS